MYLATPVSKPFALAFLAQDLQHAMWLLRSTNTLDNAPVGHVLQVIRAQLVLVEENVVVRRPVGALQARVAVEEEVVLGRVHDDAVHHRA